MAREELLKAMEKYAVTVDAEFVPYRQARKVKGRGLGAPTLNWRVTLRAGGREVLTTDYTAGCAHCPSYKPGDTSAIHWEVVEAECQTGYRCVHTGYRAAPPRTNKACRINPDPADVVACILSDCDVADYATFAEWADSTGTDPDSLSGYKTYQDCLAVFMALHARVGASALAELKEAARDF